MLFKDQYQKGNFGDEDVPEIETIDSFQGREKEVVIFSCVRSNKNGEIGFLKEISRLNVAMSRAQKFLCVIGNKWTIQKNPFF